MGNVHNVYRSIGFTLLLYAMSLSTGFGFNVAWKSGDTGRVGTSLALFFGSFAWFIMMAANAEYGTDQRARLTFARIAMVWPVIFLSTFCGMSIFFFARGSIEEALFWHAALITSWLYAARVHYDRATAPSDMIRLS